MRKETKRAGAGLPTRALLTNREAANWIAFGTAEDDDLSGWGAVLVRWGLASAQEHNNGMVLALRALATGQPLWTPRAIPPDYPDRTPSQAPPAFADLEAQARRIVAVWNTPAAELADQLQMELTEVARRRAAFADAELKLADAAIEDRLREIIHPPLVAPYLHRTDVTVWYRRKDVLELWPLPTDIHATADPPNEAHRQRGPYPATRQRVIAAMRSTISSGLMTPGDLRDRKPASLVAEFGANRETVNRAREELLSEFAAAQTPTNSDKH